MFDVTFNFTWDDALNATPSKSHYYVKSNLLNPARPSNWVAPIDYRAGKVHIYLEVIEKPAGSQKQGWALCYVGGGSYGCPYSKYYTEKGIYENEVDMTSFYNNATIDWTKGISEVDLVYTINDSGQGHVHFFPELKDLTTPTKVRIAMVQLSKGATYDASQLPASMSTGQGGAGGLAGTGETGGAGGSAAGAPSTQGGSTPSSGGSTTSAGATFGGAGSSGNPPTTGGISAASGSGGSAGTSFTPTALNATNTAAACHFGGPATRADTGWLLLAALGLVGSARRRALGKAG